MTYFATFVVSYDLFPFAGLLPFGSRRFWAILFLERLRRTRQSPNVCLGPFLLDPFAGRRGRFNFGNDKCFTEGSHFLSRLCPF